MKVLIACEESQAVTKEQMEQLKIKTFSNCVYGSIAIKGWKYHKIKNLKRKDQIICLKQLSQ